MAHRRLPIPKQADHVVDSLRVALDSQEDYQGAHVDVDVTQGHNSIGSVDVIIDPASSTAVYHGLGHVPSGWRVIDRVATGTVAAVERRTAWDAKTITIANDSAVTVTLRVEVF